MTDAESRIAAAESIAEHWTRLGIPFLVAHGLEGYPERIGRDLDILMPQRLAPWALEEAQQLLAKLDWPITACPPPLWGLRLVALRFTDSATSYLELHTMERLRWALLELGTSKFPPTDHVGPFPINSLVTLLKAVVLPLLAGDVARFNESYLSELDDSWQLPQHRGQISTLFGEELANRLAESVRDADPEALIHLVPELRRRCGTRMLGGPRAALRMVPELAGRKLGRLWKVSGARVRLEQGGTEQDWLVTSLASELLALFVDVEVVDSDPGPVQRLGQQYQALSRQSAILEVARNPEVGSGFAVTYRDMTRHFELSSAQDAVTLEAARWVMELWAAAWRCAEGRS